MYVWDSFQKKLISQFADDLYDLALKKISGTVVINHLGEKTSDWHEAMQMFISPKYLNQFYKSGVFEKMHMPFGQPYKPDVFKKIFSSKGRDHDGAVIFYLSDGLIDSVSTKLPTTNHYCQQCAHRGTRDSLACSFSNFTAAPIIVISDDKYQISLFWKTHAQIGIGKADLKKELLATYITQETLTSIHKHWSSMGMSTSKIEPNPYRKITFVKLFVDLLADDFYALACKHIGGTVIINHNYDESTDWHEAMETFIARRPFDQPYKPGVFEKIFTSKGREHDGAVIFYLAYGLIDSVSAILSMMKHECDNKCLDRGARHISACYFSKSTSIPIVVISEEKGEVSLFWKGRAQFGIDKEDLKMELFKSYAIQSFLKTKSYLICTEFDDQYFTKLFSLSPCIPNDNGYKWFFEFYIRNHMDLHKGTTCKLGENEITVNPENPQHYAMVEEWANSNARRYLQSYNNGEMQCFILSQSNKRLGGCFYKIVCKAIVLFDIFLLRQLLHNGFALCMFSEVRWKKIYPHCNRIEFFVPRHLVTSFADFIEDLKGKEDPSLLVKHHMDPTYNVGFVVKWS
ncbi:disA bacterial checkpoint controller nucleotide-binding domain-containing protein [Ditylenchus destructor]|nr:disA bacterial checkpoint controller nucleotide-binding domain-containing protein [Ditylenchus destructor]